MCPPAAGRTAGWGRGPGPAPPEPEIGRSRRAERPGGGQCGRRTAGARRPLAPGLAAQPPRAGRARARRGGAGRGAGPGARRPADPDCARAAGREGGRRAAAPAPPRARHGYGAPEGAGRPRARRAERARAPGGGARAREGDARRERGRAHRETGARAGRRGRARGRGRGRAHAFAGRDSTMPPEGAKSSLPIRGLSIPGLSTRWQQRPGCVWLLRSGACPRHRGGCVVFCPLPLPALGPRGPCFPNSLSRQTVEVSCPPARASSPRCHPGGTVVLDSWPPGPREAPPVFMLPVRVCSGSPSRLTAFANPSHFLPGKGK